MKKTKTRTLEGNDVLVIDIGFHFYFYIIFTIILKEIIS